MADEVYFDYTLYGRYYNGQKFKAEVGYSPSAPAAVSVAMSEIPMARVVMTSVKKGEENE